MEADQLYQSYSKRIHLYLKRFVNEDIAEDLLQEVFIKVSQNLATFRGDSSIKNWIYRIATNTAKDFLKSRAYRESTKQTSITETELENYDASSLSELSIVDKISAKEMKNCILEFIHHLPVAYSSVLILSELEELSSKEIANTMNISVGTVKVRLHRGRARLKKELEEGCMISTNCNDKLECERK